MVHRWLLPPLQVHSSTRVPLAVPAPMASRQSPDWTPVTTPLGLTSHCWLGWPLQDQTMTLVPGLVPAPLASRQSLPYTRSSCAAV
jgi:hypothetical protein